MPPADPQPLSPSARSTALLVARLIFYNGLLMGLGCLTVAIGVFFFEKYNLRTSAETQLVGAVFSGLTVLSFGFAAMAKSRIARLKRGR